MKQPYRLPTFLTWLTQGVALGYDEFAPLALKGNVASRLPGLHFNPSTNFCASSPPIRLAILPQVDFSDFF